jgi:hypothetical protein
VDACSAADGGIARQDDLHVDQIDAEWAVKQRWLDAGLEAYRAALELRTSHHLDLVVVLAFSITELAIYLHFEFRDCGPQVMAREQQGKGQRTLSFAPSPDWL